MTRKCKDTMTIRWNDDENGELMQIKCNLSGTGKYGISLGKIMDRKNLFDTREDCEDEILKKYSEWKTFKIHTGYTGGFFNDGNRR